MRDAATCEPTNGPDVARTVAGTCSPRSLLQHRDAFDGSLAILFLNGKGPAQISDFEHSLNVARHDSYQITVVPIVPIWL